MDIHERTENQRIEIERHRLAMSRAVEIKGWVMDIHERMENQRIEIERLREAMAELLSGHDNLYRAHWGHLPTCNPEDDIAAKAARALLSHDAR